MTYYPTTSAPCTLPEHNDSGRCRRRLRSFAKQSKTPKVRPLMTTPESPALHAKRSLQPCEMLVATTVYGPEMWLSAVLPHQIRPARMRHRPVSSTAQASFHTRRCAPATSHWPQQQWSERALVPCACRWQYAGGTPP